MTAEQIREIIQHADPKLLAFADQMRERFGAKLAWLKTPQLEIGKPVTGAVRAI